MEIKDKFNNFYLRWNINTQRTSEEIFEDFKTRTTNSIMCVLNPLKNEYLGYPSRVSKFNVINLEFFRIAGIDVRHYDEYAYSIYEILDEEDYYIEYIKYLEILSWVTVLDEAYRAVLCRLLEEDINNSGIDLNIKLAESDIIFYPKGAKLLDNKIVNDVLDWLCDYEESYKHFTLALAKYQNREYERNIIDDMRLSLELFIKNILNNDKSLENQIALLGNYLKEKQISNEIRNMYVTLIKFYTDYQNHNVKHNVNINPSEIEFMIYLTGNFMRLILCLEE